MTAPPFPILYEDNHLLVVNKPAMLPTMGVAAEKASLLTEAKAYIGEKYNKPGNVYLGIVSRLDAPVTGAVVIARTSKAAGRLSEQFRRGTVEKIYWAVVTGQPAPPEATLVDHLRKDERHRKMHVAAVASDQTQEARLAYRTLQRVKGGTLLEVTLETGRKHQIRVQLAHDEHPILGDRKYGSQAGFPKGIALHSRRVSFEHPVRREPITITAPLPASWDKFAIGEREMG